ncbi:unnamed protein product [Rotaria sordida]|uniref:Uncharacterized protein n=1 Tax=Rotaria sordida TaxID=392033 RepID=A0A814XS14_9BILA|nr:unnamed protein product [Rotaria sordida]CAF4044465.1 unnamed protein product [Rotaria sordida]
MNIVIPNQVAFFNITAGTRPTWLISSNETNFVDTDDDEKSDPNDYISDVKNNENEDTESADANENNTPIEKSSWYYPDDHGSRYDSYQTEPVEPDRNAVIATVTTTVSPWNYNAGMIVIGLGMY